MRYLPGDRGTIARTATNVRAGARGPVAGIAHAVFLLLFILLAAPLAAYIPLAALAGVLAIVAWNMAEKHEFAALLRSSRGDAAVLLAIFGGYAWRLAKAPVEEPELSGVPAWVADRSRRSRRRPRPRRC